MPAPQGAPLAPRPTAFGPVEDTVPSMGLGEGQQAPWLAELGGGSSALEPPTRVFLTAAEAAAADSALPLQGSASSVVRGMAAAAAAAAAAASSAGVSGQEFQSFSAGVVLQEVQSGAEVAEQRRAAVAEAAASAGVRALLASCVHVTPTSLRSDGAGGAVLHVAASLTAQRPFDTRADLLLRCTSAGGEGWAWKAPLRVTIAPAPTQQTLVLESPALHTPVTLTLALANDYPTPAHFTAAFSLDTPPEFRVAPSAGVLPSSTAADAVRGTGSSTPVAARLAVTFTPREYGQVYLGRLVVDSAVAQWAYRVEGRVRAPVVPAGAVRVQDHLSSREQAALTAAHTATRRAEGGK